MKKAKYIVLEGTEGCGKSTHTKRLADYLTAKGYKVLQTKEPGTPLSPLTMELRGMMLDAKHTDEITTTARELISQAIRSVHIEKVIIPALSEYDFIIQDRGLLSGFAYGSACGNSHWFLTQMASQVVTPTGTNIYSLYDKVILLRLDPSVGLLSAQKTKQEFAAGDAIEAKGDIFMRTVAQNMDEMVQAFPYSTINMEGKTIDENFAEILRAAIGE